jgi:hypothetical protein
MRKSLGIAEPFNRIEFLQRLSEDRASLGTEPSDHQGLPIAQLAEIGRGKSQVQVVRQNDLPCGYMKSMLPSK